MKLFYRNFGSGQPLIILHGVFGLSDNWVSIGKKIAEKFNVFILDQRNHGKSPHSEIFNYYALVDDLLEFLEDHQIQNPIILGHSMGGKVAMRFALENPDIVEKLIIIDISPRGYDHSHHHASLIMAMKSVDFEKVSSRKDVENQLITQIQNPRIIQFLMKNLYWKDKTNLDWKINLDAICDNITALFEAVKSEHPFTKSTLFVKGGKSNYIIDDDFSLIHHHFPKALIKTIDHATHWVHAEAPNELCAILSQFLEKECQFK
ncbi:alpha/beta fold hydrolase [candidate division KSB1 bacterium]